MSADIRHEINARCTKIELIYVCTSTAKNTVRAISFVDAVHVLVFRHVIVVAAIISASFEPRPRWQMERKFVQLRLRRACACVAELLERMVEGCGGLLDAVKYLRVPRIGVERKIGRRARKGV